MRFPRTTLDKYKKQLQYILGNSDLVTGQNIKEKSIHIEVLRIIAILFVIYNHTNTHGFMAFQLYDPSTILFWILLFNAIFIKAGPALFFAISGALLIPKSSESISDLYRKRVKKYLLILLTISLAYVFENIVFELENCSLLEWLCKLYSSGVKYHLWFLYAYIAYLMLLPILRCFSSSLRNEHFIYLIILHLLFRAIPPIEYLINNLVFSGQITFSIKSDLVPVLPLYIFVIPLIGYYVENIIKADNIRSSTIAVLWMINILSIILCAYSTYVKGMMQGAFSEGNSQSFFATFSFYNATVIYITIKKYFGRLTLSHVSRNILCIVGDCCFGIYLFHPVVKDYLVNKTSFLYVLHRTRTPVIIIGWIYTIVMFLCSLILVAFFKKVVKIVKNKRFA